MSSCIPSVQGSTNPLTLEHSGHSTCNTFFWVRIRSCAVKFNGTYPFEVFVPFASSTRDVPSVERDDEEQECPFAKLNGIVPARNQFSVGVDNVVLHEFIVFEVEFVR